MKIAALLYILQLSASNYQSNSGCQLLIKQLNSNQQKASSWSSILNISKNLDFNYSDNETCNKKIVVDKTKLNAQVIYGNIYNWHQENSCIEFIAPENKVLTNRERAVFTCLTKNIGSNQENKTKDLTIPELYVPEENKCGSTYRYAEIVDGEVVFKNSCGDIIKAPDYE